MHSIIRITCPISNTSVNVRNTFKTSKELEMRKLARRSIVILKDTKKGDKLTEENIGLRRAGNGLAPVLMKDMLGSFASQDLVEGNLLELKNVQ